MKIQILILSICYHLFLACNIHAQQKVIDVYQNEFTVPEIDQNLPVYTEDMDVYQLGTYLETLIKSDYSKVATALVKYKSTNELSDWMYYQLVRRVANYFSPKSKNYNDYTLVKWALMRASGYDVRLAVLDEKLLFYVFSVDEVYDIPYFDLNSKRYVCLNKHDFKQINFEKSELLSVPMPAFPKTNSAFSYKINLLPEFTENNFTNRFLDFEFKGKQYHFNIKVNNALDTLFANYPVVDYAAYFNIPMSKTTYNSLIPELKQAVNGLVISEGVDYLMSFVKQAFAYENDIANVGKEQRNAPELTLLKDKSDCDDRVALLYFLVKEIYNLPMIVVQYPTHVLLGIQIKNEKGFNFDYDGIRYLAVDPTPQEKELTIGEISKKYKKLSFEVAYVYKP